MKHENFSFADLDIDLENDLIADRFDVRLEAQLCLKNAHPVDIVIHDISTNGFKGEFRSEDDISLPAGGLVWLTLPGFGTAKSAIIWAKNNQFGGQFTEPVDIHPIKTIAGL